MQTIKPANNYIFCEPIDEDTKTSSGILLGDSKATKMSQAQVINIGDKVKGYARDDKVVFKSYAPIEVTLDRKDYYLIHEEDVIGHLVEVKNNG